MKAFVDTGFLLTILTQRNGAETAWGLLRSSDVPIGISSLQLFMIRHGLARNLLAPEVPPEMREVCISAIKLLNWLLQQEVLQPAELDYHKVIALAHAWAGKLAAPFPSLLIVRAASAALSGARVFLSFDPRTRALVKNAGLNLLPHQL